MVSFSVTVTVLAPQLPDASGPEAEPVVVMALMLVETGAVDDTGYTVTKLVRVEVDWTVTTPVEDPLPVPAAAVAYEPGALPDAAPVGRVR